MPGACSDCGRETRRYYDAAAGRWRVGCLACRLERERVHGGVPG
jgi:hypothetical protein